MDRIDFDLLKLNSSVTGLDIALNRRATCPVVSPVNQRAVPRTGSQLFLQRDQKNRGGQQLRPPLFRY